MQLTFLAGLAAVAVGVSAQTAVSPEQTQSVLMVLATALPSDVRSYALASGSAFAAEMSSSLAAGSTPGWYASMPADVKSILPLLYPVVVETSTTPIITSTASSASATPTSSASATPTSSANATPTGSNSTSISAVHSATLSATLSASGNRTATRSFLPQATGAASHAQAAVGGGLAGIAGFLVMLAL